MRPTAVAGFRGVFGGAPQFLVRAPGRINLIGDHTDYTGGWVLPMAIGPALIIGGRASKGNAIAAFSEFADERMEILEGTDIQALPPWARYVAGVWTLLRTRGIVVPGLELWIGGDLPIGKGLASSAAFEVGVGLACLNAAGAKLPPMELARLCQQAEHEFASSPCGIMDQTCCVTARRGHALLIDCRGETVEAIPLAWPARSRDPVFVVIDSGVKHSVAGEEYAARRRECEAAMEQIRLSFPNLSGPRDLVGRDWPAAAERLDGVLCSRMRHLVTENARVVEAVADLRKGDAEAFGRRMNESHNSLRDDFHVSCPEMEAIVASARGVAGVHGARMTGGGFGGSAIALVEKTALDQLRQAVEESFRLQFGRIPALFPVCPTEGAAVIHAGGLDESACDLSEPRP